MQRRTFLCTPAAFALAASARAQAALPVVDAEVRQIDKATQTITLRHGDIKNVDMPAMTMVFTAIDPKLLQGLKPGDKVRFTAGKKDETFLVIAIEPAK